MKPSIRFGLLLGVILTAIPLIFYALGIEKVESLQTVTAFINVGIIAVMIFLGIRDTRNTLGNGFISFGSGFSAGFVVSLIGAVISAAGTYLYLAVINPGMITYIKMKQEEELIRRGLSDSEIEKMAGNMEFFSSPAMMVGMGFAGTLLLGLVVTLICAGILKKEDPSELIS